MFASPILEVPVEQIYTIPVNEAFDECREKPECGCPMCRLYLSLVDTELDLILGASMMEPDVRIKTNEQGFCPTHYRRMLKRRRMLGMGLMMESHLAEVKKVLKGPATLGNRRVASLKELSRLEDDCYVCGRVGGKLNMMTATVVYLYESDGEFRKKLNAQPFFCLPHYRALIEYASKRMAKRNFADFSDDLYRINEKYLEELSSDVSWFCKKFDYRFDEEPWYNSKDSVKRAIAFLGGQDEEE